MLGCARKEPDNLINRAP